MSSSTSPIKQMRSAVLDGLEVLVYEEGTPDGELLYFLLTEGLRGARLAKSPEDVSANGSLLPVYFGMGGDEVLRVMPETRLSSVRGLLEWKRAPGETFKLLAGGALLASLDVPLRQTAVVLAYQENGSRYAALEEAASVGHIQRGYENDRDVVLSAAQTNGRALERASLSLTEDHWVVIAAVRNNARALLHANDRLLQDFHLMLVAVSMKRDAFRYVAWELKNDSAFIREVVQMYPTLLREASESVRSDRGVVLEAVKRDASTLEYASISLVDDEVFVGALREIYDAFDPPRQLYVANLPVWSDILYRRGRAPVAKQSRKRKFSVTDLLP